MSAPGRRLSLRAQLLGGLAAILLVVLITLALSVTWAVHYGYIAEQLLQARLLGSTVASLSTAAFAEKTPVDPLALQRVLGLLSGGPWHRVEVVDAQGQILATSLGRGGDGDGAAGWRPEALRQALVTEEVVTHVQEGTGRLEVHVPMRVRGQAVGVTRLLLPLPENPYALQPVFWLLLLLGSAALIVFVALVVSRYVARPVEAMQRAAAQVAAGDLTVRLAADGPAEFASLADSFNQMTASLKAQQEQLIRSAKLASVGRLAAGVAHEIGNPLQAIIGFVDLLRGGEVTGEAAGDLLVRMEQEAVRIHTTIRELLDYSRPDRGQVEAVRWDRVVEQAWRLVSAQKRAGGVVLHAEGLSALPPVMANEPRLVQVLLNLLLNAVDAMGGAGEITIAGEPVDETHVALHVANSGPLIPEEERSRVFDPFYTTKDPGVGTGLGLAVSRTLIESYGGTLDLRDDQRTAFAVVLPAANGR